jgi:hypothetical protein
MTADAELRAPYQHDQGVVGLHAHAAVVEDDCSFVMVGLLRRPDAAHVE